MFLFEKGGLAVAGYHFEPKGEKAIYYHKYIMRRMGLFYIILVGLLHSCVISSVYKQMTAFYILLGLLILHSVIGIILFNTNKNIKKTRFLEKKYTEEPNYTE